jgi:hemerythrin
MPPLPWKEEYQINVRVIDAQHRRLAALVGEVHDHVAAGRPAETVGEVLDELVRFTRLHFATEEELMLKYGFPHYAEHRAEHKGLLHQLETLRAAQRGSTPVGFGDEGDIGGDWVLQHLLDLDAELGVFLNERGVF